VGVFRQTAVIRNPIDNKPYIPGSSLKGKMRSLIELRDGTIGKIPMGKNIPNPPSDDPNSLACRLFGSSTQDDKQRPSHLIVRDGKLLTPDDVFKNTDLPFTEAKTEVVIDRITAAAMPRTIERVPAGAEFKLDMVLNIFEGDNENELKKETLNALLLVQNDYLGGSGSRGSGQVKFKIEKIIERAADFYKNKEQEKDITKSIDISQELM